MASFDMYNRFLVGIRILSLALFFCRYPSIRMAGSVTSHNPICDDLYSDGYNLFAFAYNYLKVGLLDQSWFAQSGLLILSQSCSAKEVLNSAIDTHTQP